MGFLQHSYVDIVLGQQAGQNFTLCTTYSFDVDLQNMQLLTQWLGRMCFSDVLRQFQCRTRNLHTTEALCFKTDVPGSKKDSLAIKIVVKSAKN